MTFFFHGNLAHGGYPQELKSTNTAVKYSIYGTAIPIVVGGSIFLASYAANGSDCHSLIVNGQMIMHSRQILTLDEEKILKEVEERISELN